MALIEAIYYQTKYASEPQLAIANDNVSLDEWLAKITGNEFYRGLVLSLTSLYDEKEKAVAWDRILPAPETKSLAPALVCSDDLDFFCTVIVVEIFHVSDCILWKRFGIDTTTPTDPMRMGESVEWFLEDIPLTFSKENYLQCIEKIKKYEYSPH